MSNDSQALYKGEFEKPLEAIKQDVFFRADNFQGEDWYDDFLLYTKIGVCQPKPEHALDVQKALKIMGYSTRTSEREGKIYVLPEASRSKKSAPREPER